MLFFAVFSAEVSFCQKGNVNILTPLNYSYELPRKTYEQKIYFGFKGGLGASFVESNGISLTNSVPNTELFGGSIANFKTSKRVSFRHEMAISYSNNFSQQGKANINFAMPWLVNYHFSEVAFVSFGLQPSLPLSSSNRLGLENNKYSTNSNLNVAGLVGIDLIFENNFNLGIRFVKTFNKFSKTIEPDYNGLQFSISYLFHKLSEKDKKLMNIKARKNKKVPTLASIR